MGTRQAGTGQGLGQGQARTGTGRTGRTDGRTVEWEDTQPFYPSQFLPFSPTLPSQFPTSSTPAPTQTLHTLPSISGQGQTDSWLQVVLPALPQPTYFSFTFYLGFFPPHEPACRSLCSTSMWCSAVAAWHALPFLLPQWLLACPSPTLHPDGLVL